MNTSQTLLPNYEQSAIIGVCFCVPYILAATTILIVWLLLERGDNLRVASDAVVACIQSGSVFTFSAKAIL